MLDNFAEIPAVVIPVLGDLFPHFYYDSVYWFIFFVVVFYTVKYFVTRYFPDTVKGIEGEQAKADYFSFYLSLAHHCVVVPLAIYRLLTIDSPDVISSIMISGGADYTEHSKLFYHCESSPYMTGYLLADLVTYALPMALKGDFLFLGHHIMSLGVSALVPYLTTEVAVYCSRIMLLEMSSIFFALRFIIQASGVKYPLLITVLEVGFAVSFFFTRVVNLSFLVPQVYSGLVADASSTPEEIRLGYFILALFVPLWALQVWWFTKIVKSALGWSSDNEKEKEE